MGSADPRGDSICQWCYEPIMALSVFGQLDPYEFGQILRFNDLPALRHRSVMAKGDLIHRSLEEKGQLIMPGVYDALSAKIAQRAGFEVVFVTGYSLSATLLGEPDFGLLTQTEVVNAAQRICAVVDVPVIVDADTGYGNAINVIRTVQDLIRVNAAGIFLEDQIWPKRCGHMKGKQVVALDE